jgi:5-(aminomethyl)-3-furanmethanol phosphate kinase
MSLTVIKIGGSLCGSQRLDRLFETLAGVDQPRLVVVAGGGLFADAVRQVQSLMPFDDHLAHRLALDAMTHLAEIFAARHPRLVLVASASAIAAAHDQGQIPIWHPGELRAGHPDIAESWTVTSDSLALWLATRLKADRLVLVKSVDAPGGSTPACLSSAGVVDMAFPEYARRYNGRIVVAGPGSDGRFKALLGGKQVRSEAL